MKQSKTKTTAFSTLSDVEYNFVPHRHFAWEIFTSTRGLVSKTVYEILGPEATGKTSLMLYLMGSAMDHGSPALYINSESKWLSKSRMMRLLSKDKAKAKLMMNTISVAQIYELKHMIGAIESWVAQVRGSTTVPADIPLVIGIDTLSKLMPPGEAAGLYAEGGFLSEASMKKMKEVGEASNLEFSKILHSWCRRLPYWLSKNNVILLLNSHQNQKVSMTSFGGAPIPAEIAAGYNKTKIGGNATNQNSLTQIILVPTGQESVSKEVVGKKIKARIVKNTSGAEHVVMNYVLRTKGMNDTETEYDDTLDFDAGFPDLLTSTGALNVTLYGKQVSCKDLNLVKVSPREFSEAFHKDEELMSHVAGKLDIQGRTHLVPAFTTGLQDDQDGDVDIGSADDFDIPDELET